MLCRLAWTVRREHMDVRLPVNFLVIVGWCRWTQQHDDWEDEDAGTRVHFQCCLVLSASSNRHLKVKEDVSGSFSHLFLSPMPRGQNSVCHVPLTRHYQLIKAVTDKAERGLGEITRNNWVSDLPWDKFHWTCAGLGWHCSWRHFWPIVSVLSTNPYCSLINLETGHTN